MSKPKMIKSYAKLDQTIKLELAQKYPWGFEKHLIQFVGMDGKKESALPYETEDYSYMIKISVEKARAIVDSGLLNNAEVIDLAEIEEIKKVGAKELVK